MSKRSEDMNHSQEQLRVMIDRIPAMVWSCLPEFLNQRWLDYTGLSIEQALDWGWKGAIHPDDLEKVMSTWQGLLSSGGTGHVEARMRRFDGEYHGSCFAQSIGRFYERPGPGAPPFVKVGSVVKEDTTVRLIEVMKLFQAVRAGVSGVIAEICVQDAQMVEYQQILFQVKPRH